MLVQNISLANNANNVTEFYVNWENDRKSNRSRRQAEGRSVCEYSPTYVTAEIEPEQVKFLLLVFLF